MSEPRVDDEALAFCCDPRWVDEDNALTIVRYRIALELRERRAHEVGMRQVPAPWTEAQVANLRRWQGCEAVHPFTCACQDSETGEVVLVPTVDGWTCPRGCGYTQAWAYRCWLEEEPPVNPFRELRMARENALADVLLHDPLGQWYYGDDTGASSLTIAHVLGGIPVRRPHPPCDAADFGRCHRLLEAMPGWQKRLVAVVERYPEWGPLVAAWAELTELSLAEDSWSMTRLRRRVDQLCREGQAASRSAKEPNLGAPMDEEEDG
jgi:hypothetical protein